MARVKRGQRTDKASRFRRSMHTGIFPARQGVCNVWTVARQAGDMRARMGTLLYFNLRMRTLKHL